MTIRDLTCCTTVRAATRADLLGAISCVSASTPAAGNTSGPPKLCTSLRRRRFRGRAPGLPRPPNSAPPASPTTVSPEAVPAPTAAPLATGNAALIDAEARDCWDAPNISSAVCAAGSLASVEVNPRAKRGGAPGVVAAAAPGEAARPPPGLIKISAASTHEPASSRRAFARRSGVSASSIKGDATRSSACAAPVLPAARDALEAPRSVTSGGPRTTPRDVVAAPLPSPSTPPGDPPSTDVFRRNLRGVAAALTPAGDSAPRDVFWRSLRGVAAAVEPAAPPPPSPP